MLKIIMGSENFDRYIKGRKFIEFPNDYFNTLKKSVWFRDSFVKEIIKDIDKAYVESGYAVHSIEYDEGYSVNDLSGGAKFLILAYMLRDNIYLATMGDNCTDFLERISLEYEKEGKDLIIVSNYLHKFNFNFIKDIEYMNWNITCHNWDDIEYKIYDRWIDQEREEIGDEEDEADIINEGAFKLMDEIYYGGLIMEEHYDNT